MEKYSFLTNYFPVNLIISLEFICTTIHYDYTSICTTENILFVVENVCLTSHWGWIKYCVAFVFLVGSVCWSLEYLAFFRRDWLSWIVRERSQMLWFPLLFWEQTIFGTVYTPGFNQYSTHLLTGISLMNCGNKFNAISSHFNTRLLQELKQAIYYRYLGRTGVNRNST